MVHGELWTIKELFTYPNEYIYWSIQIVMYPFMTGLVAGAFVLSSLYHVFGVKELKDIARFALVFSFALLPFAPLPVFLHLQRPEHVVHMFMTPHFTSAIAAFTIVFLTYASIVGSEIWFLYRKYFVEESLRLGAMKAKGISDTFRYLLMTVLTLGAYDISEKAQHADEKAIRILAGIGIPVAAFLHGYAGFIFGSVKANALWMTPLMPVIFIMSAVVSGIALCIITYTIVMEARKLLSRRERLAKAPMSTEDEIKGVEVNVVRMTTGYLRLFMIFAFSLELLDLIFRGYTSLKSWDTLRAVIYQRDFYSIFVLQYGFGNVLPFIMLLLPGLTVRRAFVASLLVLMGVFMMRWNIVIGGQAFSVSFSGFMHYVLPIVPHDLETFKEGLFGALAITMPFILFWIYSKFLPLFPASNKEGA